MKTNILHLIFILLLPLYLQAQEWSNPVTISANMEGLNTLPDFCVDTTGVLHCVWAHKIAKNYWKIYYSKSEDKGDSWSVPQDLSLNNDLWMTNPHIVADSHNKLYLTYDYNAGTCPSILMKIYDGTQWSPADTLSTNMHYSHYNKTVIDHNDRVYIFWQWGERFRYRYYEDNQYSDIFSPYSGNIHDAIHEAVIDSQNNIHIIGSARYSTEDYFTHCYFKYDYAANQWSSFTYLGRRGYFWVGSAITLDYQEYPHCVWRDRVTYIWPHHGATFYSYFNGEEWLPKQKVKEFSSHQTLTKDINHTLHLIQQEKGYNGYNLVHYIKTDNGWGGREIIDHAQGTAEIKVISYQEQLFVVYTKKIYSGQTNTTFIKLDTPLSVAEQQAPQLNTLVLQQNYPNPCSVNTTIRFWQNISGHTSLKIFDVQGHLIAELINNYKPQGQYSIVWDLKTADGHQVPSGVYLYRLQVNNRVQTRLLIIK